MGRILSGIQPTGNLHIGNYLGAIQQWVALQKDFECFFCIVDLHSLTLDQDPEELRQNTLKAAAVYIASGVDPERSTIFHQSAVSQHSELMWLLSCRTPLGWLNRMTQFKEKAGKAKEMANLGLYAYPVLMAADILVYKATHVPVGEDQKQHLELARDLAQAFNHHYQKDLFVLPEPQILGVNTRVMSLRDGTKKMSKSDASDYSRLHLMDSADELEKKILKAKTDSGEFPEKPEEAEERPEIKNLLNLYSGLSGKSLEAICEIYQGKGFAGFKKDLAEIVVEKITPIQKQALRLLEDKKHLEDILRKGAEKAQTIAETTLKEVKRVVGLLEL